MMTLDWEQAYVLRICYGFEIPVNIHERPNPEEWTELEQPRKGAHDYIPLAVCGQPITRYFSPSTKTFYEVEREKFVPSTLDVQTPKPMAPKPVNLKPQRINSSELEATTTSAGFSSIENFFQ